MQIRFETIPGVATIALSPMSDERGSFSRIYCRQEFAAAGLPAHFEQMNLSRNPRLGTLRGAHYQLPPHGEGKLVRVQQGRILDVAIDLRPDSPSFGAHVAKELSAVEASMLFVPAGCAHAFLTLEDDTEVFYMATEAYVPGAERGVRFDDPYFGIDWPLVPTRISAKDASWPDFEPATHRQVWASLCTASATDA